MEVVIIIVVLIALVLIGIIVRRGQSGDELEPLRRRFNTGTVFHGGLLMTSPSHPKNPPGVHVAVTEDALHLIHDITGVQIGEIPVNTITSIALLDESGTDEGPTAETGAVWTNETKARSYIRIKWGDENGPLTSVFEFLDDTDARVMYVAVQEAAKMPAA